MASRKSRPVLFEVASRTARARVVPPRPGAVPPSAPARPTNVPAGEAAPPSSTPVASGPTRVDMSPLLRRSAGGSWSILRRVTGGRAWGWPHLVVGGTAVLVVIVVLIYALTRATESAPRRDDVAEALNAKPAPPSGGRGGVVGTRPEPVRQVPLTHRSSTGARSPTPPLGDAGTRDVPPTGETQPPKKPPVVDAGAPEKPAAPPVAEAFEPQKGRAYIVVQHLSKKGKGPAAAEGIRDYLNSHGIPAAVRPLGPDLVVMVTEPIDKQNRARADELIAAIKKLGRDYNMVGGYSLDGAKLRDF